MITNIGIVIGEIWHYLDEKGPSKLADIVSSLDRNRDVVLMSLGWLARESHVMVEGDSEYTVTLRKDNK